MFVSAGVWQARGEEAGKPCEEKVWARGEKTGRSLVRRSDVARRNETYYAERGEEKEEEGEKSRRKKKAGRRRRKRSEKAPEEEESGAKKKEKQEKSPGGRRKRGEGEGKEGKKPRKRNEMVARRKTWKDLYPFKGTDLCREVYPRGN